jgi:hypothetical protein
MKKTYWLLLLLLGVLLAPPGWAQTARSVAGIVTSSTDQSPLPGVTVLVKGTTVGSTTGADGRYSLQAAPGATLVFSFIGFTSQERAVSADGAVDVALKESTTGLDEVVVTAYNIAQDKRTLVTSVQEVKSKDIIDSVAAGDVYAVRVRNAEVMLLRILSVWPSTAGSAARVRFEYRSL